MTTARKIVIAACLAGLPAAVCAGDAASPPATCRATILKSYPNGTWLENLGQDRRGRLFLSVTSSRRIDVYEPGKGVRPFAELPIHPMGIAVLRDRLVVAGDRHPLSDGEAALTGNAVVEVGLDGKVGRTTDLPDARMLNGVVVAPGGAILVADSRAGKIWRYRPGTGAVDVWLADDLLAPPPGAPPAVVGANGLKVHDRTLFISNSGRKRILQVPISAAGAPAGPASAGLDTGVVDDFDIAGDGSIVAAPYSTRIIAISPRGEVRTVLPEGADGATAVSLIERRRGSGFYALTTGNLLFGGKGTADLLRVDAPGGGGCGSREAL